MTLFDDTELFMTGRSGRVDLNLPDADVTLIDGFFTKEESDRYYNLLMQQTPWREYEMEIFDKVMTAPRMVSWFQDPGEGQALCTHTPLTPELQQIRSRVEQEVKLDFNAVLLNLYRNGNDGVAWHSDHTDKSARNPVIASVSFGETRLFRMRHKTRPDLLPVEIPLHHGSFLLMAGTTNSCWQHQVPKTSRNILPRINLTFRRVLR